MSIRPTLWIALLLTGCSDLQQTAPTDYTTPESFLQEHRSTITVPLTSDQSINEMMGWIAKDAVGIQLQCNPEERYCERAAAALKRQGIRALQQPASVGGSIALITLSTQSVKECDPSYVNNVLNMNNYNHPSFGCATTSNVMNMIADKRQITDPLRVGAMDAKKAVQKYNAYQHPPKKNSDTSKSILKELVKSD